jgi:hypothetical protein
MPCPPDDKKRYPAYCEKANIARCDFKRSAQHKLPDKQERKDSTEARATKGFFQINVASARARQRGGQFTPDESVAHSQQRSEQPSEHALRSARGAENERDRDKRSDPDHVAHVQRDGLK